MALLALWEKILQAAQRQADNVPSTERGMQATPKLPQKPPKKIPKTKQTRQAMPPVAHLLPEQGEHPALPFLLIRDRYRTLRIIVRRNGQVEIKVPFRLSEAEAIQAVQQKRLWIEAKRHAFCQHPVHAPHRYANGELFYYVGKAYTLRLREDTSPRRGNALPQASLCGLYLEVRGINLSPERVQKAIERWQTHMASTLLTKRLQRLHYKACARLGDALPLPKLHIRALKRRWGSCARQTQRQGPQHKVTLARGLAALPLSCVDYVIWHELCHMRIMNHSPAFHALLARLLPNERRMAQTLHQWSMEHPK